MNKEFYKDGLGWGFVIWLIGYVLGFMFFAILPRGIIGWAIMPIGIIITIWVLHKKIHNRSFQHYVVLAITWTLIAIIFDYLLIVKAFKPTDGYYKLDVYLYYTLTFVIPLLVGRHKKKVQSPSGD